MRNLYGLHLGGSQEGLKELTAQAKELGADIVQAFASDPQIYGVPKISSEFKGLKDSVKIVIHSPYWVSFFNPKVRKLHMAFIKNLDVNLATSESPIYYVTHTGTPPSDMSKAECRRCTEDFLAELYSKMRLKSTVIAIENSAFPVTKYNIDLEVLEQVKETFPQTELCLDTEHAYAAGEDILAIRWLNYKLIHMNAIPWYVNGGEGLDRHSWSLLSKGKPVIYDVIDSLRGFEDKWIIMERRDPSLSLIDLVDVKNRLEDAIVDREEGTDFGAAQA